MHPYTPRVPWCQKCQDDFEKVISQCSICRLLLCWMTQPSKIWVSNVNFVCCRKRSISNCINPSSVADPGQVDAKWVHHVHITSAHPILVRVSFCPLDIVYKFIPHYQEHGVNPHEQSTKIGPNWTHSRNRNLGHDHQNKSNTHAHYLLLWLYNNDITL